jgi:hypothetical protein
VSEGFVAFVVGLVLVLLAVRAVGRRSHEGAEPVPVAPSDDAGTVTRDGTGS